VRRLIHLSSWKHKYDSKLTVSLSIPACVHATNKNIVIIPNINKKDLVILGITATDGDI
jgi:hypothetical protein